jgi:flagellar biosynthesis protein FlhG
VAEIVRDQAEGLRRLFAQDSLRAIMVAGGKPGVGKTHVVINLAVNLARRGKRVLVLDGQHGKNSLAASLGIKPRFSLTQVIRRERLLDEVMVEGAPGVAIIQAAQGFKALPELDDSEQDSLISSFEQISRQLDVVLVDAGSVSDQSSLSLAAQEIIIVVSAHHDSITEAYGLIKQLSRNFAKRHFHILVNKAESRDEAFTVHANMAQVAGRFLDVTLDFMGYIPFDEKLKQAAILRRPVSEVFPTAEASLAFKEMADAVDAWPYPETKGGGNESFMQRLIASSRLSQELLDADMN